MILVKLELHDKSGEAASNATTDHQTYFIYVFLEHIKIHPHPMFITKGRGKTGVKKATEQQAYMRICHYCNQTTSHDSRNYLSRNASALSPKYVCLLCFFLKIFNL